MKQTILKKQYEIDKVFLVNPWKLLTYSEVQKFSKKSSKGYIYQELNKLIAQGLIKPEKIGKRMVLYNIQLETAFAQRYWGFLNEYLSWNREKFPFQIVENLISKMPTPFFNLIATGSYAKGTQKKDSDLDIVIISDYNSKSIYSELKYESETSIPKVHLYVFTKQDFLEMLLSKKENYGKEIARKNMIFFGGTVYYSILSEAIKNGFKG